MGGAGIADSPVPSIIPSLRTHRSHPVPSRPVPPDSPELPSRSAALPARVTWCGAVTCLARSRVGCHVAAGGRGKRARCAQRTLAASPPQSPPHGPLPPPSLQPRALGAAFMGLSARRNPQVSLSEGWLFLAMHGWALLQP